MKRHARLLAASALLLGLAATPALAQPQIPIPEQFAPGLLPFPPLPPFSPYGFGVYGTNEGPEGCAVTFQTAASTDAWNQNYGGPETYFSVPAGPGIQEFYAYVSYLSLLPSALSPYPWWTIKVDGQVLPNCTAERVQYTDTLAGGLFWNCQVKLRIRHTASYAWPSGVHEFSLSPGNGLPPNVPQLWSNEVRFKAVMIGTSFSQIDGYYNTPVLPLYILRDPPGDASYSSISNMNDVCTGTTSSITTGNSQNGYFKARIGVAGSIPFVGLDYNIYGEVGANISASRSETSSNEYLTCLSSSSTYTTSMTGPPDDIFICSAQRYAYGKAVITTRPACGSIVQEREFASAPVNTLNSQSPSESRIRNELIPQLITSIANQPAGPQRDRDTTQLSVWYQTLAMNDAIKANAPFDVLRSFSGGGSGQSYSLSSSNTESYAINFSSQLEEGISFEFGVNIGGSGITAGGSANFQQGYGSGENGTNVATNTVEYHLEDDDASDQFSVKVFKDQVFGTYVFVLDSTESSTSCEYEGGYQLDQPQLWIGSMGTSTAQLNEVAIGGNAIFPIYACNNTNVARTYVLTSDANSNPLGAIISGYNGITSGSSVSLTVPANSCGPVGNIYLSQPDNSVVDFDGILLTLSSACGDDISSAVSISAHFGVGNFGSYCQPSSASGPTLGDYVDGVVLSTISNTGTGSLTGASYTDYSAQFNAPLSRNAALLMTVTPGSRAGGHFAAWIDYDRNGTFEPSEKLGEFQSAIGGQSQNIAFTVPMSAQLGSTILRIRGVDLGNGEPAPVDPCYSYQAGETEDYAVTVNANAPLDCAGVANGTNLPGTTCNDNNANTGNDTWTANCQCVGQAIDCAGTPGGAASPGTACNDNNAGTGGDVYNANCECIGLAYDCLGIAGGLAVQGSACNDNNPNTGNDVYNASCQCAGQLIDCLGVAGGTTLPGSTCNDNDPLTTGDVYTTNCQCAGVLANDCLGVAGGTAQPGTPCDDGNATTGNDVYATNCTCAGLPFDCAGIAGGSAAPGTPCNDGNPLSIDDVYNANCDCIGTLEDDCAGVPGGPAQAGTPCDDANANTGNDSYNSFCECMGQTIDCLDQPGGNALPGTPCDDGNANTVNDVYTMGCECEGSIPTGITEVDPGALFTVQPNPSTGQFTLNNPAQVPTRIEVRDGVGRLVMQPMIVGTSRASTIDLSGVASGTYFLNAEAEGKRQVIKIMLQH